MHAHAGDEHAEQIAQFVRHVGAAVGQDLVEVGQVLMKQGHSGRMQFDHVGVVVGGGQLSFPSRLVCPERGEAVSRFLLGQRAVGDKIDHPADASLGVSEAPFGLCPILARRRLKGAALFAIGFHIFGQQIGIVQLGPEMINDPGLDLVEIVSGAVGA